jgi:hypothetical protein
VANRKQHPFNQMVAEGNITDHSFIHKFGAVPALSNGATGSVWDINDTVYPWSAFDTAGVVNLDRANTSDANKVVTVIGLDADYNETQESITLTDASNNTGTVVFKRVFRAFVADGVTNVGYQRANTDGSIYNTRWLHWLSLQRYCFSTNWC